MPRQDDAERSLDFKKSFHKMDNIFYYVPTDRGNVSELSVNSISHSLPNARVHVHNCQLELPLPCDIILLVYANETTHTLNAKHDSYLI